MFDGKMLHFLADYACGDARVALNSIELIIKAYGKQRKNFLSNQLKSCWRGTIYFMIRTGKSTTTLSQLCINL